MFRSTVDTTDQGTIGLAAVARWTIDDERVRRVDPSPGRDTEAAFTFYLQADGAGAERQITVEYARGAVGSIADASANVRQYLDEDIPPRRLIVDSHGVVSAWVD
jgi:hypothetical protein